jgi:hypothetical protein
MLQYAIKVLITAVVVVAVSELGKRSSLWGAVLASLPLTSLLAFIWLYRGTHNVQAISSLSTGIFWLVLASLPLFLILPALLWFYLGAGAFWRAAVALALSYSVVNLLLRMSVLSG